MLCPLTGVEGCQKDCMWLSVEEKCFYTLEHLKDKELAKFKGVTIPELKKLREEGQDRIVALMLLHKYLEYVSQKVDKREGQLPKTIEKRYPFNLPDIQQGIKFVVPASNKKMFQAFLKDERVTSIIPIEKVLHVSNVELKQLRNINGEPHNETI